MSVALPIGTPMLDGVPVRFFRSPEVGPHLPGHSLEDLHRAMKFPPDLLTRMLGSSRAFKDGDFKTIATAECRVVIGSHLIAQGMIDALMGLTGDMPPMQSLRFTLEAARNALGGGGHA